jgi:DNA-binding NarL/FixJ family response regulator
MLATPTIRLVVADDHPIYRQGLINMIDKNPSHNIHIIGEACNGEELISEVVRKKPDVVLTDISMPIINGIEACGTILKKSASTCVIALTMYAEENNITQMFTNGAKGYVIKTADIKEIVCAVEAVHAGEMFYCSTVSSLLIKKIGPAKFTQYQKNNSVHFSEKEIELMQWICKQLTAKEIAGKMQISVRTVEEYSRNIRDKIDAKSLVGIALYALKNNIVAAKDVI